MVSNFNRFELSPFIVFLDKSITWGDDRGTFDLHYIDIMTLNSHFSVFLDKSVSSDDNRRTFY